MHWNSDANRSPAAQAFAALGTIVAVVAIFATLTSFVGAWLT